MSIFEIIIGSLLILFSIAIVYVVLSQEGKEQSMGGVITGGAKDTFLSKNKSRVIDNFLSKWTSFIAIVLMLLVVLLNVADFLHWF